MHRDAELIEGKGRLNTYMPTSTHGLFAKASADPLQITSELPYDIIHFQ